MSAGGKAAKVRFYFDADVLGLAKVIVGLRYDATYPGDPGGIVHRRRRAPCSVTDRAAPDSAWIPVVAEEGWLIITRDSRIQHRRAEISAVRDSGAKMIALGGRDAGGIWQQLEVLFTQWPAIDRLTENTGPFIFSASRSGLRQVPLD